MKLAPLIDPSAYLEAVEATIGVRLPRAYLAQGRSVGLTDGTALVAGFTVIPVAPFRSLRQVPAASRALLERALSALPGRVVEMNGLFMRPEVKDPSTIVAFWRSLASELERVGARYVLFSHCVDAPRLHRFYSAVKPFVLYAGPVLALEGMSGPGVERVSIINAANIAATVASPQWLSRRIASRAEVSL